MVNKSGGYIGFAFEIKSDTIYHLPKPTCSIQKTVFNGLSDYTTIVYLFKEAIFSAKQFQAICTIKILLQEKIPSISFIDDEELHNNYSDNRYYINELKRLISPNFVKYQKPLLAYSKKEVYSNICKYAQRLHYEKQLHLEGVIYCALTINSKLNEFERFSNKDILKKAYSAYLNVQLDRPQKLEKYELKKAHIRGANSTNENKKLLVTKKKELINKYYADCIRSNGKLDLKLLSEQTSIPRSSLYRLLSNMNKSPP